MIWAIKIYAACSLLFTGWTHNKRRELTDLEEPIRARAEELILP